MNSVIVNADVVEWAKQYKGEPFQALLGDAPYHLQSIVDRFGKNGSAPAKPGTDGLFQRVSKGFMGQSWDGGDVAFRVDTWEALSSVLFPGAFLMVYGGCRTYHRMAMAMEDAGLIIHPSISWLKQHSMPKATRLDTQIDREAGLPRKSIEAPITRLAQAWAGHRYGGQVLKPMFEFIAVAQKPYENKPAKDIVATGAGAINVEAGRHNLALTSDFVSASGGAWPGNVVLEHMPGCRPSGMSRNGYTINRFDDGMKPFGNGAGHPYQSSEHDQVELEWQCEPGCQAGLDGRSRQFGQTGWIYEQQEFAWYRYAQKVSAAEAEYGVGQNEHPTLKSIALNRWLASLMLPPSVVGDRRILVPFAGVGSEMIGAMLAGWDDVIGVELEAEYIPIAEKRISAWATHRVEIMAGLDIREVTKPKKSRKTRNAPLPGQMTMF